MNSSDVIKDFCQLLVSNSNLLIIFFPPYEFMSSDLKEFYQLFSALEIEILFGIDYKTSDNSHCLYNHSFKSTNIATAPLTPHWANFNNDFCSSGRKSVDL